MLNYWNEYVHRALVMAITSLKIWLPFVTDILWYAHVLQSHLATYGITTFVINIHVSLLYLDALFSTAISCFWMGFPRIIK